MARSTLLVAAFLVAAGCAGKSGSVPPKAPAEQPVSFDYLFPGPNERSGPSCPATLRGVRIASIPTDAGMMFVFTTDDGLSEVRRRARALATELDRANTGQGDLMPPAHRLGGIATTTRYEDIPEGASIEIMALHADQSDSLRDRLDRIAREMQRERNCPSELLAVAAFGGLLSNAIAPPPRWSMGASF